MDLPHIAALGVFTSYFVAIIGLFSLIFTNLYASKRSPSTNGFKIATFTLLTIASFAHTWIYMFKYMAWSFATYEQGHISNKSQELLLRVASWLYDTSLFEEAWSLVCFHPLNWWWSEQLCLFTVGAWTIFVATEGRRHGIEHLWAYMLLGQIVAISVASNLFYLAILLSPPPLSRDDQRSTKTSPTLWLNVFLSLASVALTPFTSQRTFLWNLLAMHALLFVPLISHKDTSSTMQPRFSMSTRALYRLIHIGSAVIHARTVMIAVHYLSQNGSTASLHVLQAAWQVLHSHPAQSSIGWDVIWTSASFIIWTLARPAYLSNGSKYLSAAYLLFATPAASLGVTAPYILQPRGETSSPADKKKE